MDAKLKHLLDKGGKALAKKDFEAAGGFFEEAAQKNAKSHAAWFGLGQVARGIGQTDTAETFFSQAAALMPEKAAYRLALGEACTAQGKPREAVRQLNAALRLAPKDPGILVSLSHAWVKAGNWKKALETLKQLVAKHSARPVAGHYCLLGLAHQYLGEVDAAVAAFKTALSLDAKTVDALVPLAQILLTKDKLDEAGRWLAKLSRIAPESPDCLELSGDLALYRSDSKKAANFYRQMKGKAADSASSSAKLVLALVQSGEIVEAIDEMQHARELGMPDTWILEKLGLLLLSGHRSALARETLELALEQAPENLAVWNLLIPVYASQGDSKKVKEAADFVLSRDPENIVAKLNLATWYRDQGRHAEAVAIYRWAQQKSPDYAPAYTDALWCMLSDSASSAADLLATARAFDANVAARLAEPEKLPERDRSPGRILRVGWLSSDIRRHAVGAFVNPLFQYFDPQKAVHAVYYNYPEEDAETREVKPHAALWRDVSGLGDESLADLVRADEIDILVDLNGYTNHNRTKAFARRAAPIQVSWLGFPGTSGMSAVDCLLIPPDPVLEKGGWCTETPWPLPDCYGIRTEKTLMDAAIEPGLPCEREGKPFTFACFNHFRKVSADCVELWRQILKATPGSQIELVAVGGKDDDTIGYFKSLFTSHGIDGERVHIRGYQSRENYFKGYNEVDLCLDPFPFNGGTTGYDSLWMGVPFVTWPGSHLAARMGLAMLKMVGLEQLAAQDAKSYVGLAVALFHDHARLKGLRAGLREKMRASPLMDAPRLARGLEDAFAGMWRRYLEQSKPCA